MATTAGAQTEREHVNGRERKGETIKRPPRGGHAHHSCTGQAGGQHAGTRDGAEAQQSEHTTDTELNEWTSGRACLGRLTT